MNNMSNWINVPLVRASIASHIIQCNAAVVIFFHYNLCDKNKWIPKIYAWQPDCGKFNTAHTQCITATGDDDLSGIFAILILVDDDIRLNTTKKNMCINELCQLHANLIFHMFRRPAALISVYELVRFMQTNILLFFCAA